jgi:hypothetical protein
MSRRGSKQDRGPRDVTAQIVELSRRFRGHLAPHQLRGDRDPRRAGAHHGAERAAPGAGDADPRTGTDSAGSSPRPPAPTAKNLTVMDVDASAVFRWPCCYQARPDDGTSQAAASGPGRKRRPIWPRRPCSTCSPSRTPTAASPSHRSPSSARSHPPRSKAAARQASAATSDGQRLVATAVALALLRVRFPGHASLWEPLVRKSERWLTATLTTTP